MKTVMSSLSQAMRFSINPGRGLPVCIVKEIQRLLVVLGVDGSINSMALIIGENLVVSFIQFIVQTPEVGIRIHRMNVRFKLPQAMWNALMVLNPTDGNGSKYTFRRFVMGIPPDVKYRLPGEIGII